MIDIHCIMKICTIIKPMNFVTVIRYEWLLKKQLNRIIGYIILPVTVVLLYLSRRWRRSSDVILNIFWPKMYDLNLE
jgi:hypothetical protein